MYSAYITTIKELRPHCNADRLNVATLFGQDVIVDKTYQVGQKVIYFPADGQLSERFCADHDLVRRKDEFGNPAGGYLDPVKRNVKVLRLRGERSEGLILPIEFLGEYGDISSLKDGDALTTFGGVAICCKYIPRTNARGKARPKQKNLNTKASRASVTYPLFKEHIDTEQLAYNQEAFKPGDTIYLTRKIHGTSARTSHTIAVTKKANNIVRRLLRLQELEDKSYKVVSGSRRRVLDGSGGYYADDKFRERWHEFFADKLPKGVEVFYEIAGWVNETTPIMAACNNRKIKDPEFVNKYGERTIFTYGCPQGENRIFVYRMTYTSEDGEVFEMPTEALFYWCEMHGIDHVPLLDKFLFTTWEDLQERVKKHLDVPEPLADGTHVAEGVVVRIDNRLKFTAFKEKSWSFKVLENIVKDEANAPDIEESEEIIGESI